MSKVRMSAENLLGVMIFVFLVLGSFLKIIEALDYLSDMLVVRLVQITVFAVLMYVILVLISFEPYNKKV